MIMYSKVSDTSLLARLRNLDRHGLNLRRLLDRYDEEERCLRAVRDVPAHYANLAFTVSGKLIAATSTLTTDLGIKNAANQAITVDEIDVGLDGTTSTNGPGIIDMGFCTYATNSPGTNSSSVTLVASDNGRPETIQSTGGKTWTVQPTVIAIWKSFLVPTYMGSAIAPLPMMKPMICKGGSGISVASTLPAAVTANLTGTVCATE